MISFSSGQNMTQYHDTVTDLDLALNIYWMGHSKAGHVLLTQKGQLKLFRFVLVAYS